MIVLHHQKWFILTYSLLKLVFKQSLSIEVLTLSSLRALLIGGKFRF